MHSDETQSAPSSNSPSEKSGAKRSLMRNLGEFVGHIVKGVKTDPARKKVIKKTVEEEDRGNVTLRRTTIEEVEIRDPK